jgi:superfamily II DNA or RNA helicase
MTGFILAPHAFDTVLRLMSDSGRLRIRRDPHERPTEAARLEDRPPWQLRFRLEPEANGTVALLATLQRGDETMALEKPTLIHRSGFLVCGNTIERVEIDGPFALAAELRERGSITLSEAELPALVGELADLPVAPHLSLPEGLAIKEVAPAPRPVLAVTRFGDSWRRDMLVATLAFDYDGTMIAASRPGITVFDSRNNRIVRRDRGSETAAQRKLESAGVRAERDWRMGLVNLTLPSSRFEPLLRELTAAGWTVLLEGTEHRSWTEVRANVRSGVDWFELEGGIAFGDVHVPLPRILEALRAKESSVVLDDGGVGLITDDLRRRLTSLVAIAGGDRIRFRRSQTALLDALLASLPEVKADEQFERARSELQSFERVEAAAEPSTFCGELRPYQREGLGWFHFLRRFGLGGCLADDMGLGKTVQVLALLEGRRLEDAGPSLVVVPRSLVFNWKQEAARFAPKLRVLDHTGVGRDRAGLRIEDENLVITTYGTLRQDITALREIEFDYVILDEAQAIKNATTAASKSARLLRGRHRLALTGTPIENRVDELWSLFEFLNPGMLGTASAFRTLARIRSAATTPATDGADTALLARVLRPVILRRTKERVAPELPPKVEQTLMVELERPQRRLYDELLTHYRQSLLPYVDRVGMARSKLKVLEALLRLRQAACHPALIARSGTDAGSAKLDVLVPKLVETVAEGHKSLVFSQFTSFLALLRKRLDTERIAYAYLDGETRDREAVVESFQQDADCSLFLISLRAGGHGLNLTAAEYVFLLDPWWNPAVEAQAIDRAHRIGQQRHVIATRLVARDTVEEKILELQQSKRDLADAILGEDRGALAMIGRAELELLLS